MHAGESREQLRQVYQREEAVAAKFIPAKPKANIYGEGRIFRTCAYCRVSTDNDAQLSSYELQMAHYRQLAKNHPAWDLRKIYADEGISGTSLKNRNQFNEMLAACEAGEYDLIVTKSVSRFARNLVDCVSLIRKLKMLTPPVGVFFETDNLFTLSENSELMLSFLATFAQEESVKKSEAMNWSLQQRFKDGKLLTPAPLGYERPRDKGGHYVKYGQLKIVESEAVVVQFIFDAFLAGKSTEDIAALLTDIGCPTKTGKTTWNEGSVGYILRNERYCGNVLTWKTFTADMFEHRHKKNRQDRDQYLYENHHDAIITPEKFEAAQNLLENRKHGYRGGFPTMQIIDKGVFKGFIPINHHWINDDPSDYFEASSSLNSNTSIRRIPKKRFSVFNLSGYQVVRSQFMAARSDFPSMTIGNSRISFNMVCMRKFFAVPYVQLLLHPTQRKIALRPCNEGDVHSIRWRPNSKRTLYSKSISCPHFCNALFQIMGWDPDYLYRVRGTWASKDSDQIIVFSLTNAMPVTYLEKEDGISTRKHRYELCPEEWSNSFGEEFYDFTLQNSFYYIAPFEEWTPDARSLPVHGPGQIPSLSNSEVNENLENLRIRLIEIHGK